MGNLFFKNRVPDGSKLVLRVEPAESNSTDSFVASARLVIDGQGAEEIWDDSQVHPGPRSKKLSSPKGYVWRVRVAFPAPDAEGAVIRAEVVKPDGTVFGSTYEFEVSGKGGEIRRATIMMVTQQQ